MWGGAKNIPWGGGGGETLKRSFRYRIFGSQQTLVLGRHHPTGGSEGACPTHPPHLLQVRTQVTMVTPPPPLPVPNLQMISLSRWCEWTSQQVHVLSSSAAWPSPTGGGGGGGGGGEVKVGCEVKVGVK